MVHTNLHSPYFNFNFNFNVLAFVVSSVSILLRSAQVVMLVAKRKRTARPRKLARYTKRRTTSALGNPSYQMRGVGFPDFMVANIRYNDQFSLSASGSTAGRQIMSLNNLHDPDVTGFGHQPIAYDQFAAIYGNFVVLASRIDVQFSTGTASSGSSAGPFVIGISGNSQNSFSTTASDLIEQPRSVTNLVGRDNGTSVQSLSLTYSPKACLGLNASDDTVAGSTSGTAPSKQFYACVWESDRSGSSGTVIANVTVTYRVKFYNIKNISPS